MALYGYDPPQPTFELIAQTKLNLVDEFLKEKQVITKLLQDNLKKAQNRMKQFADKKRLDRQFEVDDWVYLKIQLYWQSIVAVRKNLKLAARFFGLTKL